jgi:hypothetical protein
MGSILSNDLAAPTTGAQEYKAKIEQELDKPAGKRNLAKMEFWERRLDSLEHPPTKLCRGPKDVTASMVQELGQPFPDSILADIATISTALTSQIVKPIPYFCAPPVDSGLRDGTIFAHSDEGEDAFGLVNRYQAFEDRCGMLVGEMVTERTALVCITEITGLLWKLFARHTNLGPVLAIQYNSKNGDGTSRGGSFPVKLCIWMISLR